MIDPDKPFSRLPDAAPVGKEGKKGGKEKDAAPGAAPAKEKWKFPGVGGGAGELLSRKEAEDLHGPLLAALQGDFEDLDEYLWARQKAAGKDSHEQPVWSDVDEEEAERLVKVLLRWGQRNQAAAVVVRATVETRDYIEVGTIFLPRIKRTVLILRETRQKPLRRGDIAYAGNN